MRILWFISVFLISAAQLSAQQHKLDSLQSLYPTAHDTMKVKLLNGMCWLFVYTDTRQGLKYAKRATRLADSIQWMRGIAGSYTRLGVCYDVLQEYDSALLAYDRSLEAGLALENDLSIGSTLNNMGLVYWNMGQYEYAADYYLRSVAYFEKIDNKTGIAHTYNNLGLILFEQGVPERALEYHEKALALRKELNDKSGESSSLSNIALVLSEGLKKPEEALLKFKEAIRLKTELNDLYGLTIAYKNMATCLISIGRYAEGADAAQKAVEIARTVGSPFEKASAYNTLGRAHLKMNQPALAKQAYDSAAVAMVGLKNPRLRSVLFDGYARYHASIGQFAEAYEWLQKRVAVNDSIYDIEKSEMIERSERIYRTERTARQLAEEKLLSEEKDRLLSTRGQLLLALSVALVLVVLAGISLFLFLRQRSRSKENLRIIAERERGIALSFEAAEKERMHIARELHDSIGQQLSGIKLALSHAPLSGENTVLITNAIDQVTSDVRNLSHRMMPGTLEKLGLTHALDHMLRIALTPGGIAYTFEYFGPGLFRLDPEAELSLFRIAQELVANIIKHAQATEVNVQLCRNSDALVLLIEDNGRGFKTNHHDGIGLQNIQNRLQTIGGSINMEPGPEGGTVAIVRLPI